ncbi:divalent cation transporter [Hydrogenovibrio sp. 3SP14C1]|uniref:ZIP family metal transporter n=1 Tax=Hydrogenovibrio sp. 3SP14C1 TaxID=3038774 RepID=UPI0024167886|nr:divalent cation transporter [Hydrogenovibrio sp. 3SP14C1]MDG4812597.1 divalent cation transporter [Hydrogenovibrio sp. 3SP14C1]
MTEITQIILYTLFAGACIPLGGLLGYFEKIRPQWLENELRHAVIAFGGGILVAAVALVLLPEGKRYVNQDFWSVGLFLLGGIFFFLMERYLGTKRREKPQLTAMLLDYLPESLALGGAFAIGAASAPLLALFIGLQNLPEGFNAYRELVAKPGTSKKQILGFMAILALLGPIIAVIGWYYLSSNTLLLGAVMLFASGGILYLIFQDIAPQAKMNRHWAPPMGAILGFCFGMLGQAFWH